MCKTDDLKSATMLTDSGNYAIVKLPGRAFPGMVFQGDSLNILTKDLITARDLAKEGKINDAIEELNYIIDDMIKHRDCYEQVITKNGYALPYSKVV
jgi:hypothetical protein